MTFHVVASSYCQENAQTIFIYELPPHSAIYLFTLFYFNTGNMFEPATLWLQQRASFNCSTGSCLYYLPPL